MGLSSSLSSGFHMQSNGHRERLNQELETELQCLASWNPRAWARQLLCVEYAHNSLVSTATGMSLFNIVFGYQPPLFISQEREVTCRSATAFAHRCCRL